MIKLTSLCVIDILSRYLDICVESIVSPFKSNKILNAFPLINFCHYPLSFFFYPIFRAFIVIFLLQFLLPDWHTCPHALKTPLSHPLCICPLFSQYRLHYVLTYLFFLSIILFYFPFFSPIFFSEAYFIQIIFRKFHYNRSAVRTSVFPTSCSLFTMFRISPKSSFDPPL